MTSLNNLDICGNLREHPLAELLTEISQIKLNGSLRVADSAQKTIVYLDAGDVVFAVSNARAFRLYEMLLRENKITKEELVKIADFTNDLALREYLLKNNLFSKEELEALFVEQIEEILRMVFQWRTGEWVFSPLVRIKGDIRFPINAGKLLIEYARTLSNEAIAERIKNSRETFSVRNEMPTHINLQPEEAFIYSRFENSALTLEEINTLSGLPEAETRKTIYVLWAGGFLKRGEWNGAFPERKISEILSANLTRKKEEKPVAARIEKPKFQPTVETVDEPQEEAKPEEKKTEDVVKEITLEEYLGQIEKSTNLYENLNLEPEATIIDIKQAYFWLAKRFHPDLFHKIEDRELNQRIQDAFSQIVQSYETLKTKSSRDVYDFRMRKELAETKKQKASANGSKPVKDEHADKQTGLALENFEQGFNLLMDREYETAIPFLARAAHFAEDNARYHAYYGKALSVDFSQRHKAESELLKAVKLDPTNADWRFMLAEFFVEVGLFKRAEGELNRLLKIFPSNEEAKTLLDSLRQK